jgi:hypothetical protein
MKKGLSMPVVRSRGLSEPSSSERRKAEMAPFSPPAKDDTKIRGDPAASECEAEKRAKVMARRQGDRNSGEDIRQP